MSSQPPIGEIAPVMNAPGVPVIRNVNWGGLKTLYVKEVRRFFKVQLQTVWAPVTLRRGIAAIYPLRLLFSFPAQLLGTDPWP